MSLVAQKKKYQRTILEGMGRALWIDAYTRWIEEGKICIDCGSPLHQDGEDEPWLDEEDDEGCENSDDGHEPRGIPPGSDLDEITPETPDAAFLAAHDLGKLIVGAEGMEREKYGLADLFEVAMTIHTGVEFEFAESATRGEDSGDLRKRQEKKLEEAHRFGFDLASQSMGQGVGWGDHHTTKRGGAVFDPKLPYFAVNYDGNELTWEGSERGGSGKRSGQQEAKYDADEHNTHQARLGRVVYVNNNNASFAKHDYVIAGPMGHVYMVFEDSPDAAFDELADYLGEHAPGLLADEEYQRRYDDAIRRGKGHNKADEIASEGLFNAGNFGRYMNSEEWRLLATDPDPEELYEIAGVAQNPCGSRKNPSPGDAWGPSGDEAHEIQQIVRDMVGSSSGLAPFRPAVFSALSPEGKNAQAENGVIGTERELDASDVFIELHPKEAARVLDRWMLEHYGSKLEGDLLVKHVQELMNDLVFHLNRTWPMPNAQWTTKIWGWGYIALTDNEGMRDAMRPRGYEPPPAESTLLLIGLSKSLVSNPARKPRHPRDARAREKRRIRKRGR